MVRPCWSTRCPELPRLPRNFTAGSRLGIDDRLVIMKQVLEVGAQRFVLIRPGKARCLRERWWGWFLELFPQFHDALECLHIAMHRLGHHGGHARFERG